MRRSCEADRRLSVDAASARCSRPKPGWSIETASYLEFGGAFAGRPAWIRLIGGVRRVCRCPSKLDGRRKRLGRPFGKREIRRYLRRPQATMRLQHGLLRAPRSRRNSRFRHHESTANLELMESLGPAFARIAAESDQCARGSPDAGSLSVRPIPAVHAPGVPPASEESVRDGNSTSRFRAWRRLGASACSARNRRNASRVANGALRFATAVCVRLGRLDLRAYRTDVDEGRRDDRVASAAICRVTVSMFPRPIGMGGSRTARASVNASRE